VRPIYTLRLQALRNVDPVKALRAALKMLLRRHRLKCISVTPGNPGETVKGKTTMALGRRKSGGGDFLPLLKFDARAGRFSVVDRTFDGMRWQTETTDVTDGFQAAFDMANLQVGWINFPSGSAPETHLVLAGGDYGDAPNEDYKEGFRLLVAIDGVTREFMSTAIAAWTAIDALHDLYLKEASKQPDLLPVVAVASIRAQKTGPSTNYSPIFKITGWVPRPADMPVVAPTSAPPAKPAQRAAPVPEFDDEVPF
jgi:hypothetical protein